MVVLGVIIMMLSAVGIVPAWAIADRVYDKAKDHETGLRNGTRVFNVLYVPIAIGFIVSIIGLFVGSYGW